MPNFNFVCFLFKVRILPLCSCSAFHQKTLSHFIKYVTFSFEELEKLTHREAKGSDITPNIVLHCLISAIIREYALLLDVLPWEQLREWICAEQWWLVVIEHSVKCLRGQRCFHCGSPGVSGGCGPMGWGTGKVQSVPRGVFMLMVTEKQLVPHLPPKTKHPRACVICQQTPSCSEVCTHCYPEKQLQERSL